MLEALCRLSSTTLDIMHAEDGPPITQRTSGLGLLMPVLLKIPRNFDRHGDIVILRSLADLAPPRGFIAVAMDLAMMARHSGTVNSSLTLRPSAGLWVKRRSWGYKAPALRHGRHVALHI